MKAEREREELYMDSVRAHNEKHRLQQLWEKLRHHERMVRIHDGLVSRHRLEVERCEALLGIDDQEGAA